MYGFQIPNKEFEITIFDKSVNIIAQTYHAFEATFIEDYKKTYKMLPILCDNCDPNYRTD